MSIRNSFSRRNFIKSAGFAGAMFAGKPLFGSSNLTRIKQKSAEAKNLIFLVSDGMNNGTLAAANHYLNLLEDRDSEWMRLYKDGLAERCLMETHSASSVVTDSAAASSAWGSGHRVPNSSINIDASGRVLKPLMDYAKEAGKLCGLVTTARITHATPAGFATNVSHRDMEDFIAEQYLLKGIDVLLGGGSRHFFKGSREDKKDLYRDFVSGGYSLCRNRSELRSIGTKGEKLLGVFSESHMPYCIDRQNDVELGHRYPSLDEMFTLALDRLAKAKEGFVLQLEAGRVDHAAHANDVGAILPEQLEFDRCIAIARRFVEREPDTLVVICTDHGTGGFMLNGYGDHYADSTEMFRALSRVDHSLDYVIHKANQFKDEAKARAFLYEVYGFSDEEISRFTIENLGIDFDLGAKALGLLLRESLGQKYAVSWTTQNHTADLVEFASFGPGSEGFPAYFENWEVNEIIRNALGI